jgi:hypothetical protein
LENRQRDKAFSATLKDFSRELCNIEDNDYRNLSIVPSAESEDSQTSVIDENAVE